MSAALYAIWGVSLTLLLIIVALALRVHLKRKHARRFGGAQQNARTPAPGPQGLYNGGRPVMGVPLDINDSPFSSYHHDPRPSETMHAVGPQTSARSTTSTQAPSLQAAIVPFEDIQAATRNFRGPAGLAGTRGEQATDALKGTPGTYYRAAYRGRDVVVYVVGAADVVGREYGDVADLGRTLLLNKHPSVLPLVGACVDVQVCLMFPLDTCDNGTLRWRLQAAGAAVEWDVRLTMLKQVVTGVRFLKSFYPPMLLHAPLTSGTVFMDANMQPRVGPAVAERAGAVPPQATEASVTFSVGLLLVEMLTSAATADQVRAAAGGPRPAAPGPCASFAASAYDMAAPPATPNASVGDVALGPLVAHDDFDDPDDVAGAAASRAPVPTPQPAPPPASRDASEVEHQPPVALDLDGLLGASEGPPLSDNKREALVQLTKECLHPEKNLRPSLTDIYTRLENLAMGHAAAGAPDETCSFECMVCMDAHRDAMFQPCRHWLCCLDCARAIQARGDPCILCGVPIEDVVQGNFGKTCVTATGDHAAAVDMSVLPPADFTASPRSPRPESPRPESPRP